MLMYITKRDIRWLMYDINSIDELVEAFGGDTALANELDVSQPAVANWKARGHISSGWHLRLFAEVHRRGKTVAPHVFGLTEEELEPFIGSGRSKSAPRLAAG